MKVKLTASVEQEHKELIKKLADEKGVTPSNLVTMWILEKWQERGSKGC